MRIVALITPVIILLPLLFWPHASLASVTISGELITVTPAAPGPHTPVTVSIADATQRPVGSSVRWFVNDIEMTENQDDAYITLTTASTDEETKVEMHLATPNATTEINTVRITPVRLDLIVGANSSVPDFYRGRALPSQASEISVQAFLFGDATGPFRYRWTVNGVEEIAEIGGTSNQILVRPRLDNEMNVYVEVTDLSGRIVAQGGTVIPLVRPELHFYESNPLHGLIANVLATPYYFLKDEITVHAEPYYFTGNRAGFDIVWKVDGRTVTPDENPMELSLVKTQEEGRAIIELGIINTNNYLETANTELVITY